MFVHREGSGKQDLPIPYGLVFKACFMHKVNSIFWLILVFQIVTYSECIYS